MGTSTRVGVAEDESRKVKEDEGDHAAAAAAAAAAFHSPEESAVAAVSMINHEMRTKLHILFSNRSKSLSPQLAVAAAAAAAAHEEGGPTKPSHIYICTASQQEF